MTRSRDDNALGNRVRLAGHRHSRISTEPGKAEVGAQVTSNPQGDQKIIEFIGKLLGQVAILTGLLYYFGWIRTGAVFSYFGIDQGLLRYSTQDYLIRSAGVAFKPAIVLLFSGAIMYAYLLSLQLTSRRMRRVGQTFQVANLILATALLAVGLGKVLGFSSIGTPFFSAVALAAGAAAAEVAASIRQVGSNIRPAVTVHRAIALGLVIVGSFWACAIYAQDIGTRLAIGFAGNLQARPSIVIYSVDDLRLSGPGLVATRLGGSGLRYRYSGLRLLIYSNERWFLLPENWQRGEHATAIVLQDSTTIRIESMPGR